MLVTLALVIALVTCGFTRFNIPQSPTVGVRASWGGCNDHATDQTTFMSNSINCVTAETGSGSQVGVVAGVTGVITQLSCRARTSPTGDTVWTFQLRKNFTTDLTGVSCSIAAGATQCRSFGTAAVARTDVLTVSVTETGSVLDSDELYCAVMGNDL